LPSAATAGSAFAAQRRVDFGVLVIRTTDVPEMLRT
jgi:hypothetical protein